MEFSMKQNKKIYVTRSSMPPINEYIEEIKQMWDNHWLTNMGEKHVKLQQMLSCYLETDFVELYTNGHMALELSLEAMGLEKGAEVITTPFTFASTTHAIVRNGLTPVFCDINEDNYTIDVSHIEELITEKTRAIMPVHVYGNVCDVEEIDRIAQKYHLKVIYDAAHAFGVKYKERGIANFGDVSCFSFHATKVFNTIEGGCSCYHDKEIGEKMRNLKNFGITGVDEVVAVGANAKMNEFCAAMGICNLRHIDLELEKRKKIVERYREKLKGIEGIKLNCVQENVYSNYAYFPVAFQKEKLGFGRDDVMEYLEKENIYARKYFYPITSEFECYRNRFSGEATPVAYKCSQQILTLPLYADLTANDVDRVCDVLFALLGKKTNFAQ